MRNRVCAGFAAALAVLALAGSAGGAAAPPKPTGDPAGLALLDRVHKAYLSVPAVRSTVSVGKNSVAFTIVLSRGVGVAEEFIGNGPAGKVTLVARKGTPTYARDPGKSCWRKVASTNPQTLEDVGLRFPDSWQMMVQAPHKIAAGWVLPVITKGRLAGQGGRGTYVIDTKTLHVVTANPVVGGKKNIVEHVSALSAAPKLPLPKPRC